MLDYFDLLFKQGNIKEGRCQQKDFWVKGFNNEIYNLDLEVNLEAWSQKNEWLNPVGMRKEEEGGKKEGLKLEFWWCSINDDVNMKGVNIIVDCCGRMETISTGEEVK